jgi:hypothetical protein
MNITNRQLADLKTALAYYNEHGYKVLGVDERDGYVRITYATANRVFEPAPMPSCPLDHAVEREFHSRLAGA